MHPALSVIFFTTLSGAGYGVLALLGAMLVSPRTQLLVGDNEPATSMLPLLVAALLLALGLVTVGLLSSTFHLGKPMRAWRAFSQWRTSWLSREGVLALATYVPAAALVVLTLAAWLGSEREANAFAMSAAVLGGATAVLALLTVGCTAMIYASLKPIPAWQHALVVPAYLGFAVQGGLAIVGAAIAATQASGLVPHTATPFALVLAVVSVVLVAIKLRYWRDIDGQGMPATRGDAVGLPGREVSVFERPHSEQNYLTREMGFVVARKHANKLRAIALTLFGLIPVVAAVLTWAFPGSGLVAMPLAALSALIGAFVERWLFFAQARHLVTLYY
ncbi:dimethyl sulfoxide reductase anchor subunit [Lysobacter sp. S4-A87]|uniref:dimethyl sulfoxide reductase anchor subunit family protein n=1 Tax=Lysobacter sp. S4-A87 TaxID=2925843 RepID=UPI001F531314|nr:DmsC/YnfH family molybdoenzyme membrane anchor subunit [Lysobacter sp. S4-A87]UNK48628.1 dimethyl sulfoxide reductase anchor subunit [Lysobacter sp. S4-A87]